MQSKSMSSLSNLRDLFRSDKEKIPPDLKSALALLELKGLNDLEERFLSMEPFLKPWAVFRDVHLLVSTSARAEAADIKRIDILWFYTQFDEGARRHDLRLDAPGEDPEMSPHCFIDKSTWGPAEFEKHLYVWILQGFQVGKRYNPWDFEYFELRNVCSAWEHVLVPIVKAVCASYSPKGRRHYGRLATFIESRSPSRLAFPEGNVPALPVGMMSPTPFRVVSKPSMLRDASRGMLTKKNYDETERELRDVYPQYGGLVERPRFKQKMDEWLAEQRARAARRKTVPGKENVERTYSPQPYEQVSTPSPSRNLLKRCSASIRRSLSVSISNQPIMEMPEPRSQSPQTSRSLKSKPSKSLEFKSFGYDKGTNISPGMINQPPAEPATPIALTPRHVSRKDRFLSMGSIEDGQILLPIPRPPPFEPQAYKPGGGSANTPARSSDPPADVSKQIVVVPGRLRATSNDSLFSPMGAPSAIPRALFNEKSRANEPLPREPKPNMKVRVDEPLPCEPKPNKNPLAGRSPPSYEGTGYRNEISVADLHFRSTDNAKTPNVDQITKVKANAPSRIPTPTRIQPIPYSGQLKATAVSARDGDIMPRPTAAPWPGQEELPRAIPWPGADDPPAVPAKNPNRCRARGHVTANQLMKEEHASVMRIVSKENIRAALGSTSPDASTEDLNAGTVPPMPSRTRSPPVLQAYNTHMFPRKDQSHGMPRGK